MSRRLRIASGIALILLSAGLFVVAWWTFESGKPGAPSFPDARPDYGVDAGIRAYLPNDAGIRDVGWTVYYRADGTDTIEDVDVTAYANRADTRAHVMIVELREAARLVPDDLAHGVQRPDGARVVTRDDGTQYVVAPVSGDGLGALEVQISGRMRIPALITENSRTSFVSPDVGEAGLCPLPAGPAAVDVAAFGSADTDTRCPEDGLTGSVTMQVEGYQRSATRLDFSDPAPTSGGGTALRWTSEKGAGRTVTRPEAPGQLRARASYVDIAGEAGAQRGLFASGVVVGLAAAVAPAGVQVLAAGLRTAPRPRPAAVTETGTADAWEGVRSGCAIDPRDVAPP